MAGKEGAVGVVGEQDMVRDAGVAKARPVAGLADLHAQGSMGYTPSGGSKCQQSSRAVMVVLLVCTALIVSLVHRSYKEVRDTFREELGLVERFAADRATADPVEIDNLLAAYDAAEQSDELCDAAFFANATSEDDQLLLDTFDNLTFLCNILFGVSSLFLAIYILTKACVTYQLSKHINREDNPITKGAFKGSFAAKRGDFITIDGMPETINQRRTRVYLRGETLGYMFLQMTADIPLITFALTYYLLRSSQRGIKCAECFDAREVCTVDSFSDIDITFKVALAAVVVSLLWNASLLFERWVNFVKFKKDIRGVFYNPRRYVYFAITFALAYALVIVSPVLVFYYVEIGPKYFDLDDTTLTFFQVLGFVGLGIWAIGVMMVNTLAGIDPCAVLAAPALCCEVSEICCEPLAETSCWCFECCC